MNLNIANEVAVLKRLPICELRAKYAEVFEEPTRAGNRVWLVKRIAWRLQALAEGDLTERARQRAAKLTTHADLRVVPPRPPKAPQAQAVDIPNPVHLLTDERLPRPGTILTRRYKGQTLQVQVLKQGFAFDGQVYRSLSAVAKAITGSHCSGVLFFQLIPKGASR